MNLLERVFGKSAHSGLVIGLESNQVFDVPIIDYSHHKIYCQGYFTRPTDDEIARHSTRPFAMFRPIEAHGWLVSFYSEQEVNAMIERARPI